MGELFLYGELIPCRDGVVSVLVILSSSCGGFDLMGIVVPVREINLLEGVDTMEKLIPCGELFP